MGACNPTELHLLINFLITLIVLMSFFFCRYDSLEHDRLKVSYVLISTHLLHFYF